MSERVPRLELRLMLVRFGKDVAHTEKGCRAWVRRVSQRVFSTLCGEGQCAMAVVDLDPGAVSKQR
jgi:hypothetical protein